MSQSSAAEQRRLATIAIVAAAFSLRIAIVGVGPVLGQIRAATGMDATVAGVLGAIPFLCMAVCSQTGGRLIRRLGEQRLIFCSLVLIAAGTLIRAVMPTAFLVLLATVPVGVGIALIGLGLPPVIKRGFSRRMGAATGGYVAALAVGAAISALTMVPLSRVLGGWRGAFAVSALPTVLALPLWRLLPRGLGVAPASSPRESLPNDTSRPSSAAPVASPTLLPRPSVLGLLLAAVFGLQSMAYAGMINWLPTVYIRNGWSAGTAGLAAAMVSLLTIPAALIVPALSDGRERTRWLLGSALVMGSGAAGIALIPMVASWVWIAAFSVGAGALFPLALTLPLDLAGTGEAVTALNSSMLGYGYILSAAGPLLVGGLYDLTGGFTVPMAVLAVLGTGSGIFALAPRVRRPAAAAGSSPVLPLA